MTFIPPYSYGARSVLNATTAFKTLKSTLGTLQTQLATGKTNAASGQRTVSEHNRTRDQETRGTHDARRNLLNRDANT